MKKNYFASQFLSLRLPGKESRNLYGVVEETGSRVRRLGWLGFVFSAAISAQAEETAAKVKEIMGLYERMKQRFIELTHSQFAVPLLDAIFERPIFRRTTIEKRLANLGVTLSGATLHALLGKLVAHGALQVRRPGKGRRGTRYELTALMQILAGDE